MFYILETKYSRRRRLKSVFLYFNFHFTNYKLVCLFYYIKWNILSIFQKARAKHLQVHFVYTKCKAQQNVTPSCLNILFNKMFSISLPEVSKTKQKTEPFAYILLAKCTNRNKQIISYLFFLFRYY